MIKIMSDLDTSDIKLLLDDIIHGYRMTDNEAVKLFQVRNKDIFLITAAADELRSIKTGKSVTWVKNQNLNCSNRCVNNCSFCGFSCKPGDSNAYNLSEKEIEQKARIASERGVTEICSVSGLDPDYTLDSYLSIYRAIKKGAPDVHLHASNPMEISYAAYKSGISTREVLSAFKEAGVNTICGTAAEILVDSVREKICPDKISSDEWVRIINEAHKNGVLSTATIMYGHCESVEDKVIHLSILRNIQDETHGFTEFVPLSFIHPGTRLYQEGRARAGATGREDLLMIAVSRIFLDNFRNIQVSWVKLGLKMVQMGLMSGANDIGGTLYEEKISGAAGASFGEYLDPHEMKYIIEDLGRELVQRRTDYSIV